MQDLKDIRRQVWYRVELVAHMRRGLDNEG